MRWIPALRAVFVAILLAPVLVGDGPGLFTLLSAQAKSRRLSRPEAADAQQLIALVDRAMTVRDAPDDVILRWLAHALRAPNGTGYVPFTLVIDDLPAGLRSAALYVRVTTRGDTRTSAERYRELAPIEAGAALPLFAYDSAASHSAVLRLFDKSAESDGYPFQAVHFLELAQVRTEGRAVVRRALALPPGAYDVYVALRERESSVDRGRAPVTAVLRSTLDVPDFTSGALSLSSVILADRIEPLERVLTSEEQAERPYALGRSEIVPAIDSQLHQSDTLSVVSFLYNAGSDMDGKPDLSVAYRFYQVFDGGERFFNRTAPQKYNVHNVPAGFDVRNGEPLVPIQTLPLTSFPPGSYRLEVLVDDYTTGESASRDVTFAVLPN